MPYQNSSPADLEAIYGVGNPEAYNQGRQQIGLNNMLQNEDVQQQQQKTYSDTLANQFSAQNNPIKLQQGQATLETTRNTNIEGGVKARISAQTEGLQLDAEKMKQILASSDGQIKQMANQAQQMAYSDDPAVQAKGKRLMQLSALAVEARQKHADEMEKQDVIRKSAERVAAGHDATTRYGIDQRAALAKERQGTNKSVEQQIATAKNSDQRVGIYEAASRQATLAGDNELAQYYAQMGVRDRQGMNDRAQAGVQQTQAAQPVITKDGIGTRGSVVPPSIATPLPGSAPPVAAPRPADGRVRVVNADGKVGSIPASQLQDALKAGYKEAK